MTKTTKQPGRVKHGEALAHYLALGADRSLEKLHRWCTANSPKAPCLRSLKGWSTKYGWTAEAAEYDARVAGRVTEKVEDAAVEETWDKVKTLTDLAQKTLNAAIAGLDGGDITADSAYEVQALLNSAVTALKHVELVSGRATNRFENLTPKDWAPEWLQEALLAAEQADAPSDEIDLPETATQH